jgi:outer membrane lipoprotein SlyB
MFFSTMKRTIMFEQLLRGFFMIKSSKKLTTVFGALLLLAGCANDYSGDTYDGRAVGEVSRADTGTVVSLRKIKIKPEGDTPGAGALLGGAAGALAGSAFGGGKGKMLTAAVGGVAGGVAGHMIQNKSQDGFEYTVRLDNGSTVVITQGTSPSLFVGQRVNIINSVKGRSRVVPA